MPRQQREEKSRYLFQPLALGDVVLLGTGKAAGIENQEPERVAPVVKRQDKGECLRLTCAEQTTPVSSLPGDHGSPLLPHFHG